MEKRRRAGKRPETDTLTENLTPPEIVLPEKCFSLQRQRERERERLWLPRHVASRTSFPRCLGALKWPHVPGPELPELLFPMPWRAEMDMCPEPELPSFFSPTMGPPHELHVRTRVHARHSIPRNKSLEGRMNCTRVSPHQLSSWLLTRSIVSSSQRPMSGCHSIRFPTQTIATTTSPLGDQSQCWNAFGNLWANHRYPDSPCNHSVGGGSRSMLECALGTRGHLRLSRPLANALGESRSMLGCALSTSGPPTPISRLPLQPLGGIKANVGTRFWEPLGHQLRNPDSLCNRLGE